MTERDSRRHQSVAKRFRDRAVVALGHVIVGGVPRLSLEGMQRLGRVVGRIMSRLPGKRRRRILEHLEIAFPSPGHTAEFRNKLVRPNFEATFQMLLEAIWVSSWVPERDNGRVTILEEDNWRRTLDLAKQSGRGLVIFTAHLGTVELLGKWIASQTGMPLMAVGGRPKVKGMEELMLKVRESSGLKLLFRGEAGIATRRHLARGGVLIMFVDHNLRGDGLAVPFFGKPAHTLLAPARLALQSGAVAGIMFGLRDGPGRFLVRCGEPMILPGFERDPEARFRQEAELTQQYTRHIEEMIRQYPEQYLWMHKRWQKRSDTRPFPS